MRWFARVERRVKTRRLAAARIQARWRGYWLRKLWTLSDVMQRSLRLFLFRHRLWKAMELRRRLVEGLLLEAIQSEIRAACVDIHGEVGSVC